MSAAGHRFVVLSPDGAMVVGYDRLEIARAVAQDYGDGAHIIDTGAMAYHPLAERIENGEPVYLGYGGWDTTVDPIENLIEAIKKGYPPMVRAFAENVSDFNQCGRAGGTPLHWAIARRKPALVQLLLDLGAAPSQKDREGTTPLDLAKHKELSEISDLLRAAIAR